MKRFISILVSLVILALIYWKIDFTKLIPVFANCDPLWMTLSLAMVIPLTLCTSWRLQQLMPQRGQLSFGESNKLILVASVLNLVLPSKMGDIAKAYFMKERGHMSGALSLSLVVFEKACDMLSLLLWCVFGMIWFGLATVSGSTGYDVPGTFARLQLKGHLLEWAVSHAAAIYVICFAGVSAMLLVGVLLIGSRSFARLFFNSVRRFAPGKVAGKFEKLQVAWEEMHGYFWKSKRQLVLVTTTSVFVWFLHLLQIWLFILALGATTPFIANMALSPLAILAGLLPLTFAGVGTRDFALVVLYAPYFNAPTAAVLGILCTARYILPAIGGMPFAGQYFQLVGKLKAEKATEAVAR